MLCFGLLLAFSLHYAIYFALFPKKHDITLDVKRKKNFLKFSLTFKIFHILSKVCCAVGLFLCLGHVKPHSCFYFKKRKEKNTVVQSNRKRLSFVGRRSIICQEQKKERKLCSSGLVEASRGKNECGNWNGC